MKSANHFEGLGTLSGSLFGPRVGDFLETLKVVSTLKVVLYITRYIKNKKSGSNIFHDTILVSRKQKTAYPIIKNVDFAFPVEHRRIILISDFHGQNSNTAESLKIFGQQRDFVEFLRLTVQLFFRLQLVLTVGNTFGSLRFTIYPPIHPPIFLANNSKLFVINKKKKGPRLLTEIMTCWRETGGFRKDHKWVCLTRVVLRSHEKFKERVYTRHETRSPTPPPQDSFLGTNIGRAEL